jgi:hypothetical protein
LTELLKAQTLGDNLLQRSLKLTQARALDPHRVKQRERGLIVERYIQMKIDQRMRDQNKLDIVFNGNAPQRLQTLGESIRRQERPSIGSGFTGYSYQHQQRILEQSLGGRPSPNPLGTSINNHQRMASMNSNQPRRAVTSFY